MLKYTGGCKTSAGARLDRRPQPYVFKSNTKLDHPRYFKNMILYTIV